MLKLFKTTENGIDIPSIPEEHLGSLPGKEESAARLAQLVREEILREKRSSPVFLDGFLKGIESKEKGIPLPKSTAVSWREFWDVQRDLDGDENLEKAELFLQRLAAQKTLHPLISDRIYYEILRKGEGAALSKKTKHVSFHYSFTSLDGAINDAGTLKHESLEYLIPGIAHALIGMQKLEERRVYIHPEYAYGQESEFPPNFPPKCRRYCKYPTFRFCEIGNRCGDCPCAGNRKKE